MSCSFEGNFVNQGGTDVFVESPTTSQLFWQPMPLPAWVDVQPRGAAQAVGTTSDVPQYVYSPPPPPPLQPEFVEAVVRTVITILLGCTCLDLALVVDS